MEIKRTQNYSERPSRTWALWSVVAVGLLFGTTEAGRAEDWPTFRHDDYRSGISNEQLPVSNLRKAWEWRSPHPPQPAWYGPAKWDAYHNIRTLHSMRDYDKVFHTVAVNDVVLFGSNVEDALICLDAANGKERWRVTVNGAVRVAPTIWNGKAFFGADDGQVYCVDVSSGRLLWKISPAPPHKAVLSDGKLVSLWPCRTGVLVQDGLAYFGLSLFPWNPSFLCAVKADDGTFKGSECFKQELHGVTLEGPFAATRNRLYAPQGRVPPLMFDLKTGKQLGTLSHGGGVFVLITPDKHVVHGPGNKKGWVVETDLQKPPKAKDRFAVYTGAVRMVVGRNAAFVLTPAKLFALDRRTRKTLWSVRCSNAHELIQAGNTLFVGGAKFVSAFDTATGKELWSEKVEGDARGLTVAGGTLYVSTTEGVIYAFRGTK